MRRVKMINLRKILPYLLYSCKRVSAIISINPSERTKKEQFILEYHKLICKACHNYQYQNDIIENSLSTSNEETTVLSEEKKAAIISTLKSNFK
ncbi:hypothetical protein [Flavobacterium macrobrachii]|nr:hypothetical protein [Flavobacterium macrobrachii]MBM6499785.1 hypothetical protein [Flavobacterium macrobrachii]